MRYIKLEANKIVGGFMENRNVIKGQNVVIHETALIYPNVVLHDNVFIGPYCIIGEPTASYYKDPEHHVFKTTEIGTNSVIRSNSIIYEDVHIGENFQTGHHVTIRENSYIGNNCSVGTLSDIQDRVKIGNFVRLHSNVFLGQLTTIQDYAWLFPNVVVTNDKYPPLDNLKGCNIGEYAIICAGSILLPGVHVGNNALVAARAVVSKDVKDYSVVIGMPAKEKGLITDIRDEYNKPVYPWKDHLEEDRGYPWQRKR